MARRPKAHPVYGGADGGYVEPENEQLIADLTGKVTTLKSLTIDMGDEIRHQTKFLADFGDQMDSTWGKLMGTTGRLKKLASTPGSKLIFYLIGFAFVVFMLIYIMIRFR